MKARRRTCWEFIKCVAIPFEGDDCLIWPYGRNSDGYGRLSIKVGSIRKHRGAHRVICIAVHGQPPTAKHEAAHSCGNGHLGCVNPRHLSWKTMKENQRDRFLHGTANLGERNGRAKLTSADVKEIADLLRKHVPHRQIAARYKVCRANISYIATGKQWSQVTGIKSHV